MLTIPISEENAFDIAQAAYLSRMGVSVDQPLKVSLVKKDTLRVQHYAIGSDKFMSNITVNLAGASDTFWDHPLNDIVHKASYAMQGGEEEGFIILVEDVLYFVAMNGTVYHYIQS
jgi:hypothetical protein